MPNGNRNNRNRVVQWSQSEPWGLKLACSADFEVDVELGFYAKQQGFRCGCGPSKIASLAGRESKEAPCNYTSMDLQVLVSEDTFRLNAVLIKSHASTWASIA